MRRFLRYLAGAVLGCRHHGQTGRPRRNPVTKRDEVRCFDCGQALPSAIQFAGAAPEASRSRAALSFSEAAR